MDSSAKQVRPAVRNQRRIRNNYLVCTCDDLKPSSRPVCAADPRFPSWESFCTRCGCRLLTPGELRMKGTQACLDTFELDGPQATVKRIQRKARRTLAADDGPRLKTNR